MSDSQTMPPSLLRVTGVNLRVSKDFRFAPHSDRQSGHAREVEFGCCAVIQAPTFNAMGKSKEMLSLCIHLFFKLRSSQSRYATLAAFFN
jgi:hypothetical protein